MSEPTSDIAQSLTYHPRERLARFRALPVGERSAAFEVLSPYVQHQLLSDLSVREIVDVLDHLDLQAAKRLVTRIRDPRRRDKIIQSLKQDIRDKVEFFLRFHPKANFSLVHFNYVILSADHTVGEAAAAIEDHYEETGKFPEILIHDSGSLIGEVPLSVLVRERNSGMLRRYVQSVQTIIYTAEVPAIIDQLTSSGKKKVVVLDQDSSVLGIIYSDDVRDVIGHLPAESLYSFTGVDSSERPLDSSYKKFKSRYVWLIVNLVTCFMAGGVILAFQDTLNALTLLAVYIPIVAGMGGNAASQTFAVTLRGITLGSVSLKDAKVVIWRELGAAALNGVVIGSIVAVVSVLWNANPMLGLVVALSMIGVHLVAAFFGALIPLIIKALGKDPAATSMIFISTTTDVCGLLLLLGLGALFLM
jgi:magnesium transporter